MESLVRNTGRTARISFTGGLAAISGVLSVGGGQHVSFDAVRSIIERSDAAQTKDRVVSIAEELIAKGRQEGRNVGALIGRIQAFQEFLGLPISHLNDPADKPATELQRLLDDL